MFKNTLKEKLLAGKHCFGMLDSTACCEVVEMLGWLGIDFILLDAEHGKLNLENLENLIRAAEHSGIAPIVRPPAMLREWIGPVLDRGARGLYLPHFNTAEDAKIAGVTTTEPLMQHYMELGALLFHGLVQGLIKEGVESYMGRRNTEIAALKKIA